MKEKYDITTQRQIRLAFKENFPELSFKKVNGDYHCNTRCEFVEFIDYLIREGKISTKLGHRATL